MPTARIITRFPDRAGSLRKTLVNAGYRVEIIPPEQAGRGFADLEYDLDSMPEFAHNAPSAPQSAPATVHEATSPKQPRKRQSLFASRVRSMTESFAVRRQELARRVSAFREAALERKHARQAEAAQRAQLREQERAEEQQRRERNLAAKREAERIAAERAREQATIALRAKQERKAQRQRETEAAAQRRAEELAAKRQAKRIAAERAREQAVIELREKQEREARRRAEAEATAQRRAAELAAKREAERLAAERAAITRRQEQEREAERQRLLQAEMERHRREQEAELARAIAELEAQRQAQMQAVHAESIVLPGPPRENVVVLPQRRRSFRERWDDFSFLVYRRIREWRELSPNSDFANTRDYAWRQALPAAAGLAIAFVLGWGLALGSSRHDSTLRAAPAPAPAVTAPMQTAAVPKAVALPARPVHAKPSPAVRKSTSKVSRRHTREIAPEEDDVVIIRRSPKRQLIARANQRNGVKTISDME